MKKLFALSLLAATIAMPVAAQAQNGRGDYSRDRHDDGDDQANYRSGQRYDVRGSRHDERDEHREARRGDYRDNDWNRDRNWRDDDHGRDRNGQHDRWSHRGRDRFAFNDGRRGLPYVDGPFRWVRRGGDALLIDLRSDRVRRVIRGYYW